MSKRFSTGPSLYEQIHDLVNKARYRWIWFIGMLAFGTLAGISTFLNTQNRYPLPDVLYLSFTLGSFFFSAGLLFARSLENFSRTDNEEKLVRVVLNRFHDRQNYIPPEDIDILGERADIGASAGELRTLFPVLALPIIIPIAIEVVRILGESKEPLTWVSGGYLLVGMLYIALTILAFLSEVDRANTDVIIRHAVAEYKRRAKYQKTLDKRDAQVIARLLEGQSHT